jgi:hypothetical protein
MPNEHSFSLLSFLLGLAIGLWIAFVVFFVFDHGDDCDCGPGGVTIVANPQSDAYVPAGDGDYYCTNNDQGGALVIDQGSAVVADQGSAIVIDQGSAIVADQGSAIVVDQGSAIVADDGGFVPVPGDDEKQLDRDRGFEEFKCETNDQGGAIVADSAERIVVVAMPGDTSIYPKGSCKNVNGNAVVVHVVNGVDERIQIDEGGAIVADEGSAIVADEEADGAKDQTLGSDAPTSDTELAYCMVATPGSDPIVIRPPSET